MDIAIPHTEEAGTEVTVHYSGWLKENYPDGAMFDSSKKRDKPFTFQLGKKKVIKGWEESLQDMCPGEKRLLEIPPHYAYGYVVLTPN